MVVAALLAGAEIAVVLLLLFVWKRRPPPPDPCSVDMDIDGSEGAVLSDLTDAYADALIAAAEAAGKPANHCGGGACFEVDRFLCECTCEGCAGALRAGEEARAATRAELGAALADVERGIEIPREVEDRILDRLLARQRGGAARWCTRFLEGGANALSEEHMRDCDDCRENKRILHAMAETYATPVSAPRWADDLLLQIEEEEARRRSAGSG